ncbi:MAG TPA: protein phosphatase 2C domain-containing protein [Streptosporangiaceae bacterium]|nr:protein phosphatase 2C domain-containing protein [Streptosporangiaceae bacterium]
MAGYSSVPTTPADRPVSWESYTASAIGADHLRAGKPNEDAVGADRIEVPGAASVQVIAVADGHGHARHFRSDRGSQMAVSAAVAATRSWAGTRAGAEAVTAARVSDLVSDVVARWRELVAADLRADPITGDRLATLPASDPPEIPYGATLLLAVLWADVAVLAQIGDGEMLLILSDGRHLEPVPTDSRLDGTRTTSLCQADAVSAFRVGLVSLAKTPAFAVFISTDGYGNAQADMNWQQVFSADLVRLGMEHGARWIGGQLKEWVTVCASSDGSGDDTTVALALNQAAVLTPPPRPRRRVSDSTTLLATLPSRPVADTEKTLIWPDQPIAAQPRDAGGVGDAEVTRGTGGADVAGAVGNAGVTGGVGGTGRVSGVGAFRAGGGGTVPFAGRLPSSRVWLAVVLVVAVIIGVSVFLLASGSGRGGRPGLTPAPSATQKPRHTNGQSVGGKSKAKPKGSTGGGAADFAGSSRGNGHGDG